VDAGIDRIEGRKIFVAEIAGCSTATRSLCEAEALFRCPKLGQP
jgi:hypothetical protein